MTDIELHAKTDRELLIIVVTRINDLCKTQEKHNKFIYGNGKPGAKLQLWVLWFCFLAVLGKLIKQ